MSVKVYFQEPVVNAIGSCLYATARWSEPSNLFTKRRNFVVKFLFWVTFLCVVGHFLFRKHFYSEALKEELFMKLEFLLK